MLSARELNILLSILEKQSLTLLEREFELTEDDYWEMADKLVDMLREAEYREEI